VARERPAGEVLAVVAEEVTRLFGLQSTLITRSEPDETATAVAAVDSSVPIGTRITLEDDGATSRVYRTGRPARFDTYSQVGGWCADQAQRSDIGLVVAVPIVVDGHLWGVLAAGWRERGGLPANIESRLAEFAELLATAISSLQARAELAASRARIVAAADDERRRVVRDLHDGAQQRSAGFCSSTPAATAASSAARTGVSALATERSHSLPLRPGWLVSQSTNPCTAARSRSRRRNPRSK
jgi:GAF domain-containing protein